MEYGEGSKGYDEVEDHRAQQEQDDWEENI